MPQPRTDYLAPKNLHRPFWPVHIWIANMTPTFLSPRLLPPVLTEAHAAAYLNTTTRKLRRLGYEKRGPRSVKLGRDRVYPREAFLEWIAESES